MIPVMIHGTDTPPRERRMDHSPPSRRRPDRFARKFEGAQGRLNLRIDAFRKRKLEAHAKCRGMEVSEFVRGWLYPLIDALPEDE
jgi:hypothetical protein